MKNSLLVLFVLFLFNSKAQDHIWTYGNPVWHYQVSGMPNYGFIRIEEAGDTLINGLVAKKMMETGHYSISSGPGTYYYTTEVNYHYIRLSNDTVYYLQNGQFEVLYDFSQTQNGSYSLGTTGVFNACTSPTSSAHVDSVYVGALGGEQVLFQELGDSSNGTMRLVGKTNSWFGMSDTEYGFNTYLFPSSAWCDSISPNELPMYSFLCYQDDSLDYNPNNVSCEFYLGLNGESMGEVQIYPNPSTGIFEIVSAITLCKITVVNLVGKTIKEVNMSFSKQNIDLSELLQGNYYLQIENTNGEQFVKSIQILNK